MNKLILVMTMLTFQNAWALNTVENLDLDRYLGEWNQLAAIPQRFARNCASNTTANYSIDESGLIVVDNQCETFEGDTQGAIGRARVNKKFNENSKLQVTFVNFKSKWFWWLSGDYWILKIGDNYAWSLVGNPKKEALWILARNTFLTRGDYIEIRDFLKGIGYNTCEILMSPNDDNKFTGKERFCDLPL